MLAFSLSIVFGYTTTEVDDKEWEEWKLKFGKSYSSDTEEHFRRKIFTHNKDKVERHNQRADKGKHTYYLAINRFADQLSTEVRGTMNGFKQREGNHSRVGAKFIPQTNIGSLPEEVDWRTLGAVTPVKDQGTCGSCYTFSATGSLEGRLARKTGKLISLSEQQILDCSEFFGNAGCNGGQIDQSFQYVIENGGIDTEQSYLYEGEQDACRYQPEKSATTEVSFVDLRPGDELALKEAIATQGPVSIGIDASHESLHLYSHGIYREPHCDPGLLDHAVLVVGYGGKDQEKYWLVKNSWGPDWGDSGYIKIAREEDNMCGVASEASYPLI